MEVFLPPPHSCGLVTDAAEPFASSGPPGAAGTDATPRSGTHRGVPCRTGPSRTDGRHCAVNERCKANSKCSRSSPHGDGVAHEPSCKAVTRGPFLAVGFERQRRGRARASFALSTFLCKWGLFTSCLSHPRPPLLRWSQRLALPQGCVEAARPAASLPVVPVTLAPAPSSGSRQLSLVFPPAFPKYTQIPHFLSQLQAFSSSHVLFQLFSKELGTDPATTTMV